MICPNIKALREDHEIKQRELCKKLGMAQNTYSQYETGKIEWTADVLIKLAAYYEVNIDYLLGLTDMKTPYPRKK